MLGWEGPALKRRVMRISPTIVHKLQSRADDSHPCHIFMVQCVHPTWHLFAVKFGTCEQLFFGLLS